MNTVKAVMPAYTPRAAARPGERGFSMIMVLIILTILSLLGVAATQMTLLSERSTRFDRDFQIAWQSAEAALLDAEFDIRGPNASGSSRVASFSNTSLLGFTDGCGTGTDRGLCMPATAGKPVWYTVDFTDESANARTVQFGEFTGRTLDYGTTGVRPALRPRYIIEAIPDLSPGGSAGVQKFLYRVTAMGFGPRADTQAVIQMVFRKE
jgi:type IV pilus assembly protein PilX